MLCATAQSNYAGRRMMKLRNAKDIQTVARFDVPLISHNGRFIMIEKIFMPLLAALFLAGAFGSVAGCNTVEGAGKDIQQGGQAIKDEAKEHKNY